MTAPDIHAALNDLPELTLPSCTPDEEAAAAMHMLTPFTQGRERRL